MSQQVNEEIVSLLKNTPSYKKAKAFAFLDCETTGLRPLTCDIIEIGIIRDGEHFETKIQISEFDEERADACRCRGNPHGPQCPKAMKWREVTGYTRAEWSNAPKGAEVVQTVARMLNGACLVGHNITFDLEFLASFFEKHGVPPASVWGRVPMAIDTMPLAYSQLFATGLKKSVSLAAVCEHLGIEQEQHHSALSGALRARLIMRKMAELTKRGHEHQSTDVSAL